MRRSRTSFDCSPRRRLAAQASSSIAAQSCAYESSAWVIVRVAVSAYETPVFANARATSVRAAGPHTLAMRVSPPLHIARARFCPRSTANTAPPNAATTATPRAARRHLRIGSRVIAASRSAIVGHRAAGSSLIPRISTRCIHVGTLVPRGCPRGTREVASVDRSAVDAADASASGETSKGRTPYNAS